jgi:hypothetical protein
VADTVIVRQTTIRSQFSSVTLITTHHCATLSTQELLNISGQIVTTRGLIKKPLRRTHLQYTAIDGTDITHSGLSRRFRLLPIFDRVVNSEQYTV